MNNLITKDIIDEVIKSIKKNKKIDISLSSKIKIHIDRQLPYLCIYRKPKDRLDEGTDKLLLAEASYIIADEDIDVEELKDLIKAIYKIGIEEFGTFFIIEIFSIKDEDDFCILVRKKGELSKVVEKLKNSLSKTENDRKICIKYSLKISPLNMEPLIDNKEIEKEKIHILALGIKATYQDENGKLRYPIELKKLKKDISVSLKKGFYSFIKNYTSILIIDYRELGIRGLSDTVLKIDDQLAKIEDSFDFLLQVSPVNNYEAYLKFKESKFTKIPNFKYRPRPFDPSIIKRELFSIRIEDIEDPVLNEIFTQKRDEIDKKLTMLNDRETKNFLYGSLQVYGEIDERLLDSAYSMMDAILSIENKKKDEEYVDAVEMAKAAKKEIDYYKKLYPKMDSHVEIRSDITSGAMVSNGNFLIERHTKFPKNRVEALLHHEIGTHILTYFNGYYQPLKLLHTGLRGYDEMQEGIAVLSEYLCGGLTLNRLKVLAARVIAVDHMIKKKSFLELFHMLYDEYKFSSKTAFSITTRVFRGGGLTKDAVYLRGFLDVLSYIKNRGKIELLYIGKIATEHIPLIQELLYRKILHKPPLYPRYLKIKEAKERLEKIKSGYGVLDIIKELS